MGNAKTKTSTPPPFLEKKPLGDMIHDLQQDIICSICLEPFDDPVSIECGHNFCRLCISAHWSGFSPHGYRCPECRSPCSHERMKPDTRLRNLVEKIGQIPMLEINTEAEAPAASLEPPVHLVSLDDEGDLCLSEEALSSCLEQGEVKDAPVCLIAILGEQRCGKSFLLNFLLRRLQNLGADEASWMGQKDEPLTGFEWRPGANSTTKGVWLWNKPFWITSEQGKVAVLLIDTEGSLDLERNKEVSTKLSTFSMLLSSYQIYNLSSMMKDPHLEYLDMFVYVAETVGRACDLQPIQHLDILVRDWMYPPVYGRQAGQKYLQDVIQMLESNTCKHPRALKTLKSRTTSCYLMPFPGRNLVMGTAGTLADMDDDFRECLKDYVSGLARSAGTYIKRDQNGMALTGAQLATKIKHFLAVMKQHRFGFVSPVQMAITLNNQEAQETTQREFAEFIREQEQASLPLFASLKVRPSIMARRLKEKQQQLVKECEAKLQGDEPDRTESKLWLESCLQTDINDFLEDYNRRYKSHALTAGIAVGVGAVGLAGGAIGAGVAGAILAAEALAVGTGTAATVAFGALAGSGTFAAIGGGVGAKVGHTIGKQREREALRVAKEEEEEEEDMSDQRRLIRKEDTP